jgi:hypothetical protein
MQATGVAASHIAAAGRRFRRESATGARTLRVDGAADIDADSPPQGKAAWRTILGAAHAHAAVVDRLGECRRHPAALRRIELMTKE